MVVDRFGLSNLMYSLANVVYVFGTHNLFEPLLLGKPLIYDCASHDNEPNQSQKKFLESNGFAYQRERREVINLRSVIGVQDARLPSVEDILNFHKDEKVHLSETLCSFINKLEKTYSLTSS